MLMVGAVQARKFTLSVLNQKIELNVFVAKAVLSMGSRLEGGRSMKRITRNKINHSIARRRHVKARALDRYALELNRFDLKEITTYILGGKAKFICFTRGCRYSEWILKYREKELKAIFDRKRSELVTLLPMTTDELGKECCSN